jgi:hypothetical protein
MTIRQEIQQRIRDLNDLLKEHGRNILRQKESVIVMSNLVIDDDEVLLGIVCGVPTDLAWTIQQSLSNNEHFAEIVVAAVEHFKRHGPTPKEDVLLGMLASMLGQKKSLWEERKEQMKRRGHDPHDDENLEQYMARMCPGMTESQRETIRRLGKMFK